jgi:nucleotide-binding universal stress UspA family protein
VYSQIVVPLDGGPFSQRALGPATRLAVASDADMLLVAYARTDSHRRDLEAVMAEIAAEERPCAVRTKVEIVDNVASAVVHEVDAEPGSLVCMSSVGRSRSELVIGSVAEAVLRDVSTPVLLVGPSVDVDRFRLEGTMDVSVDESSTSHAILPIAASWSIVFHLALRVVTVLPVSTTAEPPLESAQVHHIANELQRDVDLPVDFDVLHGDAAACIIDDVTHHANLLAMSTHGHTGLKRLAAGSVAMAVVHGSIRPVLVDRPEHFR